MAGTQAEIDALLAAAEAEAAEEAAGERRKSRRASSHRESWQEGADAEGVDPRVSRILRIRVPLMVVLARRKMAVHEILNVCTGAIIEFDKPFDEELELLVNERPLASGHAVKIGENFGLRITHIGDVRSRIDAMGRTIEQAASNGTEAD